MDKVRKTSEEQGDVCTGISKQNATRNDSMAHEKKEVPAARPVEEQRELVEECRDMAAADAHHQEQQLVELNVVVAPKNKQDVVSRQPPPPPPQQQQALSPPVAMTLPFSLSAGFEFVELQQIIMGNGCRVVSIQRGNQAWESRKIRVGDVVSKINGQSLSELCYEAIVYLLHRELRQEVTFFRPHSTYYFILYSLLT
jgi:hypothetical protein